MTLIVEPQSAGVRQTNEGGQELRPRSELTAKEQTPAKTKP
jgi:hypothetical protein